MLSLFKRKANPSRAELSQLLSEFNRSLMLIADKSLLISNFISKIKQICPVEIVHLFVLDEPTGNYKPREGGYPSNLTFSGKDKLISWLFVNERSLVLSRKTDIVAFFTPEEQEKLRNLQAELIHPLKVMNKISGVIILGRKSDGTDYNENELGVLSLLFNQAAFAIEHASLYEIQSERIKKMYRSDRLATLGELAAGAAHEIRNPLTAIRSTIQYLGKDFSADAVKAGMVAELIAEVERIDKIVQGLLSFARPSILNPAEVNLEQLIDQTLLLANNTLKKQQVEVEFEYFTADTTLRADAGQLRQVFLNIILNAAEAMGQNPEERPRTLIISIEKGVAIDERPAYLLLSFEDNGNGIEEKDLDHIYNPFFTTKEEGTGLGLAICYGIVSRHEGEIEARSTPGKGTCFTLKLPRQI